MTAGGSQWFGGIGVRRPEVKERSALRMFMPTLTIGWTGALPLMIFAGNICGVLMVTGVVKKFPKHVVSIFLRHQLWKMVVEGYRKSCGSCYSLAHDVIAYCTQRLRNGCQYFQKR